MKTDKDEKIENIEEESKEIQEEIKINAEDFNHGKIKEVNISTEMKDSFLSYAMSVIVSRALPDIRDGLKPVQRRIVYAMNDLGIRANTQYKKSARIVGEVIGKYHPHGDSSVYEAMVRMAQDFNYLCPLVDGHGNFGSIDGDGAAAMRYTEARMSKIAMELVRDLDKNTVDFVPNYDNTEMEPVVLPAKFPNLLVNGSTGIAVGMATNIPPHNLGEVVDGLVAYIDNPRITAVELLKYIKGPDFPTGGEIIGLTGMKMAYETGQGMIAVRAKMETIEYKNKNQIIVTEIPYLVNKTTLLDRIATVAKEKLVEGITDLRDESTLKGIKIVIETKKDVPPAVLINNLYKYTQLQSSFSINMVALINGQPQLVSLLDIMENYVAFQVNVIQRRTQFLLDKANARMHILEGLIKALNNIDKAIDIIKKSKTAEEARLRLKQTFKLDDIQAQAILDMRLQKLTGLEIANINKEANDLRNQIRDYESIIKSDKRKLDIIKEEALEIKNQYAEERKSEINIYADLSIENEDLIPVEDVIVTVTKNGYIKRMTTDSYKIQNRGGVGLKGVKLHDDDFVEHIALSSTHDFHLFFTNKGRVYKLKGYQIPEGSRQARGIPIVNLLSLDKDETLASFTSIKSMDDPKVELFFTTKKGTIKRTKAQAFKNINVNGIKAIILDDNDELLSVKATDGTKDIILAASNGKAIRFNEAEVRSMGRSAGGVRGMKIGDKDEIVGVAIIDNESKSERVLVITEKGYGKQSHPSDYRRSHRGGMGVKTLNVTEKNGPLKTIRTVNSKEDLIVSTNLGIVIRCEIAKIAETGRVTQGVRIIRLKDQQQVATVAILPHDDENDGELQEVTNEAIEDDTEVVENKENTKESKAILKEKKKQAKLAKRLNK